MTLGTLGTLLQKLKNKMEIRKFNSQNDFEKGQGSLGPYKSGEQNIGVREYIQRIQQNHLQKFGKISAGALLRFVKYSWRFQRCHSVLTLRTNSHALTQRSPYPHTKPSLTSLITVRRLTSP